MIHDLVAIIKSKNYIKMDNQQRSLLIIILIIITDVFIDYPVREYHKINKNLWETPQYINYFCKFAIINNHLKYFNYGKNCI